MLPFSIMEERMEDIKKFNIPIWEKYMLSIEEAAEYFRIGENKLRNIAHDNPEADWVFFNNNRIQIKRKKFELFLDTVNAV